MYANPFVLDSLPGPRMGPSSCAEATASICVVRATGTSPLDPSRRRPSFLRCENCSIDGRSTGAGTSRTRQTQIGTRLFRNGLRDARAHHAKSQTNSRLLWRGGAGTRRARVALQDCTCTTDRSFSRSPHCTTSYVRFRPIRVARGAPHEQVRAPLSCRRRHPRCAASRSRTDRPSVVGILVDDTRAAWFA
ncbi:hypothetical protein BD413DRAFT_545153 [Trametes elegans]|nr:hypothetical protein BD413DRAFT_545145 [Trametes elegans]KAI0772404.1 hypothetical protein BD413DRAFT_545153 [Trametes elegans]